jgi:hypothetical protein
MGLHRYKILRTAHGDVELRSDAFPGQFRTHAAQQTAPLIVRLVSAGKERWGNCEAEGSAR